MIDNHIDLTESQIFARGNRRNFLTVGFNKFPWGLSRVEISVDRGLVIGDTSDNAPEHKQEDIIIQGTRQDRHFYSEINDSVEGYHCDRCGKLLKRIPWSDRECTTLCERCERELDEEVSDSEPNTLKRNLFYKSDNYDTNMVDIDFLLHGR